MPKPSRYLKGVRGGGGKQHGSRGRGRGRGGNNRGGGGRGRGRRLHPSSFGYVYEPGLGSFRESDDGLLDDFPVFGQFGAVDISDDSDQVIDEPLPTSGRPVVDHRSLLRSQQNGSQRAYLTGTSSFMRGATLLPASYDGNMTDDKGREADDKNDGHDDSVSGVPSSQRDGDKTVTTSTVIRSETIKYTTKQPIIDPIEYELDVEETNVVEATSGSGNGGAELLPFYVDTTPTPIKDDDVEMETREISKAAKRRAKKKAQKKKIIPGDDIYLGSSSSSSEEHDFADEDDDDDIAAMRDYIENVHLDDDGEENEADLLAMLRFANNGDPAEMRDDYAPSDEEDDDDDDNDDSSIDSENARFVIDYRGDQDTLENGAFDKNDSDVQILSEDEFNSGYNDIGEPTTEDLYNSLRNSLDEVPPSLQAGLRGRIAQERRKEKKAKRAEKQLARMQKRANKKDKRQNNKMDMDVQLRKIDQRLQNFIADPELMSYQFAPMSRACRRQLHILASAYGLTSESFGTGKQRAPVVRKTAGTMLPSDRHHIEMFIRNAQTSIDAQSSILRKRRNLDRPQPPPSKKKGKGKEKAKGKNDKSKDKQAQQQSGQKKMTAAVKHGTVVGANVAPISESNVGHRMLAAMGWKQGDALGANNDGIRAPIEAVVRTKRFGLGS